jgi:hypothetical protein
MPQRSLCPICSKRRAERFCPAQGEKICAVCCGTERERTLNCPPDCSYLIAAHRYEQEHRKPLEPEEMPFAGTDISRETVYEQQELVSALGQALARFAGEQPSVTDSDALAAIIALGETYRTLVSGIYYEKRPDPPLQAALYAALGNAIQEFKSQQGARGGLAGPRDSEAFQVLVYLARIYRGSTNGRPRSRLFLNYLRGQYAPAPDVADAPRIVVP